MGSFEYLRPSTLDEARQLTASRGARPMGGGTDLLPMIRDDLLRPLRVVDLRGVRDLEGLSSNADGSIRIGAATRLATLARDDAVVGRAPVLAQACAAVGSLQLRYMGTLGGNLGQRVRCWYFRHGHACFKNGGAQCLAAAGENRYHAVFETGACVAVHPSDPAVALSALEATIAVSGADGDRAIAMPDLFVAGRADREIAIADDELIVDVTLPAESLGGRQGYWKLMQRGAWDFATVSLAAVKRANGDVRLVLGGVASRPWRVTDSVEEDVASGGLSAADIETLAERALYDARPLSGNAYKVAQAAALLRRGIAFLASTEL